MARSDDDTWDPATGVGVTATFGAAARAVAGNKGLINDPFAEPLVRAAGVEYFTQVFENRLYGDGLTRLWGGGPDDLAVTPRYVTASRRGMPLSDRR